MFRTPFIPARNSRHRRAVLALYRALLRSGAKVPLSKDALPASGLNKPIERTIKRRFEIHQTYTSNRLIFAAMTAGYNYLTLLTKAQQPGSTEHNKVLEHIREYPPLIPERRRSSPATSPATRSSQPRPPPLLRNTANAKAGEPPKYVSDILPRAKESFEGDRKVPVLAFTAQGQPFLRYKKPQPRSLSQKIGLKDREYAESISRIVEFDGAESFHAALEDQWDYIIDQMLEADKPGTLKAKQDPTSSFAWTLQLSKLWYEYKVERIWTDWIARGKALQRIVDEEEALAAKEQNRPIPPIVPASQDKSQDWQNGKNSDSAPSVRASSRPSMVDRLATSMSDQGKTFDDLVPDTFAADWWRMLVDQERSRMLATMKKKNSSLSLELPRD